MIADYLYYLWIGGGIGFVIGLGLLAAARAADRKNYIIQRATPMPLSLVNERDDVWLRGEAECDQPLTAPHFGLACLHYRYKLEERRSKDSGKGGSEWKTRESSSESAAFLLRDGELAIGIDGKEAEFAGIESETEHIGKLRHTISYMPYPSAVSAVGSVSEGKGSLEKYANIPLLVTPKAREDYVRDAESGEASMRKGGFFFIWVGAGAGFYGLFDHLSWPVATEAAFAWQTLAAALGAGTAVYSPIWALYVNNTFVAYSVRVENAWRQIDVDLKMRYELIPNLVEAVKGYMKHEKELLTRLVALRGEAVSGGRAGRIAVEGRAAQALVDVSAVVENYPDLKAQPVVAKLVREMKALEEKIAHGRTTYNDAVREYNENVMSFPRMFLARMGGFKAHPFFEATGADRAPAKV